MRVPSWLHTAAVGAGGAFVGALLILVGYHAWVDHFAHHQMIEWINTYGPRLAEVAKSLPAPK